MGQENQFNKRSVYTDLTTTPLSAGAGRGYLKKAHDNTRIERQ